MFGKPEMVVSISNETINALMTAQVQVVMHITELMEAKSQKDREKEKDAESPKTAGKVACLEDKLTLVREKLTQVEEKENKDHYDTEHIVEWRLAISDLLRKIEGLKKHGQYYSEY